MVATMASAPVSLASSTAIGSRSLDFARSDGHTLALAPRGIGAGVESRLRSNALFGRSLEIEKWRRGSRVQVLKFVPVAKVAEGSVGTGGRSNTLDTKKDSIQSGLEKSFKISESSSGEQGKGSRTLRLIVAGGGIGGLVLALAAKKQGLDVIVLERDASAIKGEGQYRGPIQLQSNALAALEAIDLDLAEEVFEKGCVTGDRINGLVDGLTGNWYCKFDTFTPAVERGLPVTRVISRMTLQAVLSKAVGEDLIFNGTNVVDFEDDGSKVTAISDDGRRFEGDLLVGADGIRSKIRDKLLGRSEATYSDYTCYTGIADFVPCDIDTVGYRVFLGTRQYFVSSDVGAGKMQWYAFYNEPAGGVDPPGGRKERLMKLFGHWCDGVVDLLLATPEEQILRRDIYDRIPIFNWTKGRVALLGDSAHAMQPNMGQGGCMAIEDSFQLALYLSEAVEKIRGNESVDIPGVLKSYENARRIRVGAIHGMARMAAIMASTYKAYLGDGLGPLSGLRNFKIPHPGRVGGRFFVAIGMPLMLGWVLGGNTFNLKGRVPHCRLEDKANDKLLKWFWDDDALERATVAEWYLLPMDERMASGNLDLSARTVRIGGVNSRPVIIGSDPPEDPDSDSAVISAPQVAPRHARVHSKDGAFYLTDLKSKSGTWVTNIEGDRYRVACSIPVRIRQGDVIEFGEDNKGAFRVKLRKQVGVQL